jgi:hypothetical protein
MPDSSQQAMQNLTAQWYNSVTTGLGLDPNNFQLIQASQPLDTTTEKLWQYFNAMPPLSVTNYFNPAQINGFAEAYGAVVLNLQPVGATTFMKIMGDYYASWAAYFADNPPTAPQTSLEVFTTWAYRNIPNPATQNAAITAFKQTGFTVPGIATNMYIDGQIAGTYAYTTTYEQLQQLLASAPSKSVTMSSSTASSDVSHTWASGSVGGAYEIFSGSANASYDKLTQQFAGSQVTVEASFDSVLQLAAAPLSQVSKDPTLSQYKPWFYGPALSLAFHNNNNIVWNNNPPTWSETFGPGGNMQRICSALIIVDGIDITVTSQANFSQGDQDAFKAAAEAGFWPFFSVQGSGGHSVSTSFSSDGSASVTTHVPAGNPQVFGAIVNTITALVSGQDAQQQFAKLEAAAVLAV